MLESIVLNVVAAVFCFFGARLFALRLWYYNTCGAARRGHLPQGPEETEVIEDKKYAYIREH